MWLGIRGFESEDGLLSLLLSSLPLLVYAAGDVVALFC
jgi:hypothetical protein